MRRLLLPLLALVALAPAGCGDGEVDAANSYVDRVNTAQERFAATVNRLSRRITARSTPAEDRRTLEGFADAVDDVVADLRAVKPPGGVAHLHRALAEEMERFGADVERVGAGLASQDPAAVLDAQERLSVATARVTRGIDTTIAAINRGLRD